MENNQFTYPDSKESVKEYFNKEKLFKRLKSSVIFKEIDDSLLEWICEKININRTEINFYYIEECIEKDFLSFLTKNYCIEHISRPSSKVYTDSIDFWLKPLEFVFSKFNTNDRKKFLSDLKELDVYGNNAAFYIVVDLKSNFFNFINNLSFLILYFLGSVGIFKSIDNTEVLLMKKRKNLVMTLSLFTSLLFTKFGDVEFALEHFFSNNKNLFIISHKSFYELFKSFENKDRKIFSSYHKNLFNIYDTRFKDQKLDRDLDFKSKNSNFDKKENLNLDKKMGSNNVYNLKESFDNDSYSSNSKDFKDSSSLLDEIFKDGE